MKKYEELWRYIESLHVVNTHCHHLHDSEFQNIDLCTRLGMTYNSWIYPPIVNDPQSITDFFHDMTANTYCYWLCRAYGELYGDGEPLSDVNFLKIERAVSEKYRSGPFNLTILNDFCKYDAIVLDDYRHPGDGHGLVQAYPTFRVDMFLFGDHSDGHDENQNCPFDYMPERPATFEEYLSQVRHVIAQKIRNERVRSLKLAIAYERDLEFRWFDFEKARTAYEKSGEHPSVYFQDYMVDFLCQTAMQFDIPFQIHTGLGKMERSRALGLRELIDRNPSTKFDLFHGSYPWTDDILGLAHKYRNVYVDMCWLPLISTKRAEDFLEEALEVVDARRVIWGCDTWTAEESYGAVMAMKAVLYRVFEKKLSQGYFDMECAKRLARNILSANANEIFRFDRVDSESSCHF